MKRKVLLLLSSVTVLLLAVGGTLLWLLLHRAPGDVFDSHGVPIYYTVEGSGDPLVLIHGVAANADLNWRRPGVTQTLARDFKVIAFDLRGHGRSGQPTDPAQYGGEMVEDVVRLMDHLHIDKAHVAGYSLGGFITLKLLATHPERVRSAAICAAGWTSADSPDALPSPYSKPVPPAPTAENKPAAAAASVLPLPAATQKTVFHRLRSWVGDRLVNKAAIKAMKKGYGGLRVPEESLAGIKVPTLLIIGDQDGFLYLAEALHARMPGMPMVRLAGANHFTAPFYPGFKRALHDFFMAHSAAVTP